MISFLSAKDLSPCSQFSWLIFSNSMGGGINLKNITLLTEPRTITEQLCRCQTVGFPPPLPKTWPSRRGKPDETCRETHSDTLTVSCIWRGYSIGLLCDFFESSTKSPPLKQICFRLAEDLSTRDRSRKQIPLKRKPTA